MKKLSAVSVPLSAILIGFSIEAADISSQIQKIEQTYQKTQTLQAEFIQKTAVALLDKTMTRPGRLFYQKGGKLRIEYAGDKMTHYISDGHTLWIWRPKTRELATMTLADSGLPQEALNFLTELGNLKKYYHIQSTPQGLQMKPKKKSTVDTLETRFDKDHYLQELTIHSFSGNASHYRFFNLKVGEQLSPKLFQP